MFDFRMNKRFKCQSWNSHPKRSPRKCESLWWMLPYTRHLNFLTKLSNFYDIYFVRGPYEFEILANQTTKKSTDRYRNEGSKDCFLAVGCAFFLCIKAVESTAYIMYIMLCVGSREYGLSDLEGGVESWCTTLTCLVGNPKFLQPCIGTK